MHGLHSAQMKITSITTHTPRFLACLATAMSLAACGGGESEPTSTTTVSLYKHAGSVQCTGGGMTRAAMERQLADAGVQVLGSSCGTDGMVYPALCGGLDGRISIFEVPASHAPAASAAGFAPLSNMPSASVAYCSGSDRPYS